jgi:hypothetical protein
MSTRNLTWVFNKERGISITNILGTPMPISIKIFLSKPKDIPVVILIPGKNRISLIKSRMDYRQQYRCLVEAPDGK